MAPAIGVTTPSRARSPSRARPRGLRDHPRSGQFRAVSGDFGAPFLPVRLICGKSGPYRRPRKKTTLTRSHFSTIGEYGGESRESRPKGRAPPRPSRRSDSLLILGSWRLPCYSNPSGSKKGHVRHELEP